MKFILKNSTKTGTGTGTGTSTSTVLVLVPYLEVPESSSTGTSIVLVLEPKVWGCRRHRMWSCGQSFGSDPGHVGIC